MNEAHIRKCAVEMIAQTIGDPCDYADLSEEKLIVLGSIRGIIDYMDLMLNEEKKIRDQFTEEFRRKTSTEEEVIE